MKYRIERMEGQHCHFVNRQDGASRLLGAGAGGDGYGHPQGLPKRRHRFRDGNISAIYQGQEILLTIK